MNPVKYFGTRQIVPQGQIYRDSRAQPPPPRPDRVNDLKLRSYFPVLRTRICFILVSRIRIRVAKNQPKSRKVSTKIIRISYIFFKTIKLMFTDINIYLINNKTDHILEKYIFLQKKSKTKVNIFPILGRIWIRIHIKMKQIRNTAISNNLTQQLCCTTVWRVYVLQGLVFRKIKILQTISFYSETNIMDKKNLSNNSYEF